MAGESLASWTLTPVTDAAAVRLLSGYLTENDIPTATITALILKAQTMTMSAIADRVSNIPLYGSIDGANLRFALPPRFLHRVILDADASGNESTDVAITLEGTPVGSQVPPTYTPAVITSIDALNGVVTLTAAPTSTTRRVLFSGWLLGHAITRDQFKVAVELLTAHLMDHQVRGPGNVVPSNPQAGTKEGNVQGDRTWFAQWEHQVALLRRGRPRAATVRTALRGYGLGRVECDDYGFPCR